VADVELGVLEVDIELKAVGSESVEALEMAGLNFEEDRVVSIEGQAGEPVS
jgi:hypothetical protein